MTGADPAHVKEILAYDPETGVLFWKHREDALRRWNTRYAGVEAGAVTSTGYRYVSISKRFYLAHRLAFAIMTGRFPAYEIDHIDGNRANNVWSNLREATGSQNGANRPRSVCSTTGVKGVTEGRPGRFVARIKVNGRHKHLGVRDTPEEAAALYAAAATKHFGDYARTE